MIKICTKCRVELSATIKYFYRDRRAKSGLCCDCKKCNNIRVKNYRQTESGKCVNKKSIKKYRQTKNGRCVCQEINKRYYNTIKGHLRHIFGCMKQRCINLEYRDYKDYGGRGIKLKFTSNEFVTYVMNILKIDPRGLQIDRINNDGHYEKGNIRFVTAKENANNKER